MDSLDQYKQLLVDCKRMGMIKDYDGPHLLKDHEPEGEVYITKIQPSFPILPIWHLKLYIQKDI